jgi:hypothetical protein
VTTRAFLPRPVRLVHLLSEPIAPPPIAGERASKAEAAAFQATLKARMQQLIDSALAL